MNTEELAKSLIEFRSCLGASRGSLMDEHDERRWDLLTEAAARLRALAEDAERLDWLERFGYFEMHGSPGAVNLYYEIGGDVYRNIRENESVRAAMDWVRGNS